MKKRKKVKKRPEPLSLYPLKTEEALAAFMQVDPAKVEEGMEKLRRKRGKK
jgi:hypothetical protein